MKGRGTPAGLCSRVTADSRTEVFVQCAGPMSLKVVVAISVFTAMPAFGQIPTDRSPENVPRLTEADLQRIVQSISGDKTKMETCCDLAKINQEMVQAGNAKDTRALQTLEQKADDLTQKLGPDYVRLMEGLDQVDENSSGGKDIAASFDEIGAAFELLDKQCR